MSDDNNQKKDENLSEDEYLKRHLENVDQTSNMMNTDIPSANNQQTNNDDVENNFNSSKVSNLDYFSFDVQSLPCGNFYPKGTLLMIRPAKVKEIQTYAMVDDNNFYDIVEKMNGMLQSCVRLKYPDNSIGSYLEIKDQDRLYIIFLIRELTFQKGNNLSVKDECDCGEEISIELIRENFVFHETDEKMDKYFNPNQGTYIFELKNGSEFEMTPPNIGIQKAFSDYIVKESNNKKTPNLAFLKIIPFMLPRRSSITYDGIKSKLKEFEELDEASFQFLNSAVSKMKFGIKELKKKCQCGEEVRTEMKFPNGASGIFVVPDAFEAYIKE